MSTDDSESMNAQTPNTDDSQSMKAQAANAEGGESINAQAAGTSNSVPEDVLIILPVSERGVVPRRGSTHRR